ncbi:MAG TPA: PIN domain-containing protein [Thermoanaerobaculia bacterium]|nr:PIN domain-containing protein [Thermoanaerobaculia bacterium]
MRIAYVDSSCLIAVALQEEGAAELLVRLSRFDRLVSSPLAEAEFRSALVREGISGRGGNLLSWLDWIQPYRRLTPEIEQILELGRPRGADLWHLACALFVRPKLKNLYFLTRDGGQSDIARALDFPGL